MSKSPTKSKQNQQPNQTLLHLHKNQIDFFNIFTLSELQYLHENFDTIVFSKGTFLVKEKQIIDYVGVIINGGAFRQTSKQKYLKGSVIGSVSSLGMLENQKHSQSIIAQSDGILFAIRIQKLISLLSSDSLIQIQIKIKMINFLAQQTLCQLKKQTKIFKIKIQQQFQLITDQKLLMKFYQTNKNLSYLIDGITQSTDTTQKQKFMEEFPIYGAKQKSLIRSKNNTNPFLLLVLKGQIIVKYHSIGVKKQTKIIDSNYGFYNSQGFIFGHNQFANLYCLSNQVIFLIIEKNNLMNNFKIITLSTVLKICLQTEMKRNQYEPLNLRKEDNNQNNIKSNQIWSPFQKPFTVQQIPIKKTVKQTNNQTNKKRDSINTYQTLYQTFLNSNTKQKGKQTTSLTEGIKFNDKSIKLGSMKTDQSNFNYIEQANQFKGNLSNTNNNQKLKKLQGQILILKQQNKSLNENINRIKLQLLQSDSKLKMNLVFKEINNLKLNKMTINRQKDNQNNQNRTVTLKQAFQKHLKGQKLNLLVAKCAYKWLQATRKNRYKKQNNINLQIKQSFLMSQSKMLNSSSML